MGRGGKVCKLGWRSAFCAAVKVLAMNRAWKTLCICIVWVAGLTPLCPYAKTGATADQPAVMIEPETAPRWSASGRREIAIPPPRTLGITDTPAIPAQSPAMASQTEEISQLRAKALAPSSAFGRTSSQQAGTAWLLGLLYLHGAGVVVDRVEAENWFARAEAQGDALAAAGLAWCEIEGCSRPSNPEAARRWISRLRTGSPSRALYLQWLLETRMAPLQLAGPSDRGVKQAPGSSGRSLLTRAAAGGDAQAKLELGLALAQANRPAEALEQFLAAATRSPAAASNVKLMRDSLLQPVGEAQRENFGPALAADTLAKARRNHRGDGQPANYVEAIRLYRLAQSQGSIQSRKMLELIFSRTSPDGTVDIQWMQQLANINLGSTSPQLDSPPQRRLLLREPTPLSDLLPPEWRRRMKQNQVAG